MKTVVITGATGVLGNLVAKTLAEEYKDSGLTANVIQVKYT